jgi:hypothetical protein
VTRKAKTIGWLALSGVLVAVILLGGSLSGLEPQLGAPIPGTGEQVEPPRLLWDPPARAMSIPVIRGFLALVFLILLLYLSFRLLMLVDRKLVLRAAAAAALMLILLAILPRTPQDYSGGASVEDSGEVNQPAFSYRITPLGQPPQFLQWVVIGCTGLGLTFLAYRALRSEPSPTAAKDVLLKEAEQAVQSLKAGEKLENVIMRCYHEMSRSLQASQGIVRDRAMTVGEFEDLLRSQGFPAAPVHQLTDLFEKARYGDLSMGRDDEAQAIESLNAVIEFCASVSR